jgi:GTPase SAR1 family protein
MLRITFDGPDGVGKTNLINALAHTLTKAPYRYGPRSVSKKLMIFREPYDWFPVDGMSWEDVEAAKKLIRGTKLTQAQFDTFTRYRALMLKEIERRLAFQDTIVLQDRSIVSTIAYNMGGDVSHPGWHDIVAPCGIILLGPKKRPDDAPLDEIDADEILQMRVRRVFELLPPYIPSRDGFALIKVESQETAFDIVMDEIVRRTGNYFSRSPGSILRHESPPVGTTAAEVLPELYAAGR